MCEQNYCVALRLSTHYDAVCRFVYSVMNYFVIDHCAVLFYLSKILDSAFLCYRFGGENGIWLLKNTYDQRAVSLYG